MNGFEEDDYEIVNEDDDDEDDDKDGRRIIPIALGGLKTWHFLAFSLLTVIKM